MYILENVFDRLDGSDGLKSEDKSDDGFVPDSKVGSEADDQDFSLSVPHHWNVLA